MLAGMNRVRRPTCADGVFHLLSCVVVPADKLEPIDDLDRVKLLGKLSCADTLGGISLRRQKSFLIFFVQHDKHFNLFSLGC
jgi:hypothetical protein